ncbi:hypothetical protein FRB91_003584 [Serendipita sp. 411]|nr:hypothetical protein FRC18_005158 [Serendipita sp. 400]KAG8854377.1 hypothetical protein FRB91_003584 [Serendipita sp. 411]
MSRPLPSGSPEPLPSYDYFVDGVTRQENTRDILSNPNPIHRLEPANLYKRLFGPPNRIHDIDDAIANQKAGLKLLLDDSLQKPNPFFVLAQLYEERFDKDESNRKSMWERNTTDLGNAIANQKAGLDLLSKGSAQRPDQLFNLARLYKRSFDHVGIWRRDISDLDNAIANQKAGLKLLPDDSPQKSDQFFVLAQLYEERYDKDKANRYPLLERNTTADLKSAIANQKAGLELLSDDFPQKPHRLFDLARLYRRCSGAGGVWHWVTSDLDNAITIQKAGLELLSSSDPQKSTRISQLAQLYEQRSSYRGPSHRLRDINNVIANHEAALKCLPDGDPTKPSVLGELVRMRAMRNELNEEVKQSLLRDLQYLAEYIKRPKPDTDINCYLMEDVINLLDGSDADELCSDIRGHSIRLGAYCEALRSQVGRSTNHDELRVLYEEIIATERVISAAHKNLRQKYEEIYTVWRGKREQISNVLSLLDSAYPQNYTKGVRTRIQQVDEGFEKIRRALDDQGRALKGYFDAWKALLVSSSSCRGGSPLGPVAPDNPCSVAKPLDPVDLPKAVEAGKERLSQVGAIVEKARYTKTRNVVEKHLFTTAFQLEELHRSSKKYASEVQDLVVSQPTRQVRWWNRWRGPSHQLPNLVERMSNRLTEIQRGFDKYKQSIFGLIFRPLGDMIDVLRPYSARGNLEVVTKRFHPDMALYEAAFRFLIENVSRQCCLAEQITGTITPDLSLNVARSLWRYYTQSPM